MEKKMVEMSAEELAAFQEYKEKQRKEAEAERRRQQRKDYAQLVDEEVNKSVMRLRELSEEMCNVKNEIFNNFTTILEMKSEIFDRKKPIQFSHTFTDSDSKARLVLGTHTIDAYRDTVEDGIAMVKDFIESLAKDENSRALVNAVLRLLSKDQKGTLKASRVLQLQKMADDSGNEQFKEGVRIIQESYQPQETKKYVAAQVKSEKGEWKNIPLSMTSTD